MRKDIKQINRILKALANERRLKIIDFLFNQNQATVGEVKDYINLSFKSTSAHLTILERAGLLEREQKGLYAFYSLDKKMVGLIKSILKNF